MNKAIAKSATSSRVLEQLLEGISLNDEQAFQTLYELVKAPIYGYSLSILKNRDDALDNMQDVFVKIYESMDKYTYQNRPMGWIFTITRNLALMKLRKQNKFHNQEINEEIIFSSDMNEEDKVIIKILMEQLTDEERQIIVMHLEGNLTYMEIAKILDLKLSTTLSKYHRAIKKLRLEWEKV